ncbi:hypothetical protein SAMN04487826_0608 [Prevotella sp. khp1]|uniref:hypothetical protein n=1 Tax=Prevotellaceae TaxID=171552 RepID=UPI000880BA8A|nr:MULTISPECIES: hypothetical protein [Prevotellaceae]QVJ80868.1 hypothetical protein J4031_00265 [Xylanibacter ruminicola]SDQ12093.1 hypothetical protein SAMN04487826_0608 [Prevotella sp. khp1]
MSNIDSIYKTPFFEITYILNDFARLDDLKRPWPYITSKIKGNRPPLLPHEACLLKAKTILMGIISSMSYMRLAILQIKRRYNNKYYFANGYTAYDFYRYHYSSFCHAITTIHDLFFKLVVELCNINTGSKRMIQWGNLQKALKTNNEIDIIKLLERYYSAIQEHEQKRNKVSHEGLLTSKMLDNYHLTIIWSRHHIKPLTADDRPEYIEGTKENKYLLAKTKKEFVGELNKLLETTVDSTQKLFELLLPKLIQKISQEFIESHRKEFVELDKECLNRYILSKYRE